MSFKCNVKILFSILSNIRFLFLDRYGAISVEKLKNFLIDCQKKIIEGKLWVALQANVLSDVSYTDDGFEGKFEVPEF